MLPNTERIYHDPLHGAIALRYHDAIEALLIRLIDTPAFQRLRRIRQLGPANLTFHGAESSRFTHSLGVLQIARRACDRLVEAYPELGRYRAIVLCAALLHDLGHGPLSHTGEEIFQFHHERWTIRLVREFEPIRRVLDEFDPTLSEQIVQVYEKKFPVPVVWQLVSSQLDCDRLDYLMRDSYFTGATYGRIDLERILMALRYDPVSQQLTIAQKGMAAVEHYLIVRKFMYAQVYNHPKNLAASWILMQAIRRARELWAIAPLEADSTMQAWLKGDEISLEDYLSADDSFLFYHLQRWQRHDDRVLSDLCRRFLDRDLFKTREVTNLTVSDRQDLCDRTYQALGQDGWSAEILPYYVGLQTTVSRGYTLYQRGIHVQTTQGLKELSALSELVQTLTTTQQRVWLIFPREISDRLHRSQ